MDQSLLREAQARAGELVEMTSISSQELLAYLALQAGHATARDLFDARDQGYDIGSIGHGAHILTDRVQKAIHDHADQEPHDEAPAANRRTLGAHA
ncbi:hypothetical protein [Salinibacter ruber]|uniref:hypothetical protein n=1 Tax=Salinibacter ruber TaxID=146919 RepID=UPI002168993B|nr:hypothetical protein [Salinibacter ruber]